MANAQIVTCTSEVLVSFCVHTSITFTRTDALGDDAGAVLRVGDPVVVLECVHRLQHGRHAPDVVVDLRVVDELRGEVRVQLSLNL